MPTSTITLKQLTHLWSRLENAPSAEISELNTLFTMAEFPAQSLTGAGENIKAQTLTARTFIVALRP
jgi:hypothetical protein